MKAPARGPAVPEVAGLVVVAARAAALEGELRNEPAHEGVFAARLHQYAAGAGQLDHEPFAAEEGRFEPADPLHSVAYAFGERDQVAGVDLVTLARGQGTLEDGAIARYHH